MRGRYLLISVISFAITLLLLMASQTRCQENPFRSSYFVAGLGFNLGASAADWITTEHALGRGAVETNPLIGRHGERMALVKGLGMGASVAASYYGWKWAHRRHSKLGKIVIIGTNVGLGMAFTRLAVRNSKVH